MFERLSKNLFRVCVYVLRYLLTKEKRQRGTKKQERATQESYSRGRIDVRKTIFFRFRTLAVVVERAAPFLFEGFDAKIQFVPESSE